MEKQIQAAQRFLGSVRSLASFGDLRAKQYTHLRGVILRAPSVSTAGLADLISSLEESLGEGERLEGLKSLLADKVADCAKERDWIDVAQCFLTVTGQMLRREQPPLREAMALWTSETASASSSEQRRDAAVGGVMDGFPVSPGAGDGRHAERVAPYAATQRFRRLPAPRQVIAGSGFVMFLEPPQMEVMKGNLQVTTQGNFRVTNKGNCCLINKGNSCLTDKGNSCLTNKSNCCLTKKGNSCCTTQGNLQVIKEGNSHLIQEGNNNRARMVTMRPQPPANPPSEDEVRQNIADRLAEDLSESPKESRRTPSPGTIVAQSRQRAEAEARREAEAKADFERCPTPETFPGHDPPLGLRVRDELLSWRSLYAYQNAMAQGRRLHQQGSPSRKLHQGCMNGLPLPMKGLLEVLMAERPLLLQQQLQVLKLHYQIFMLRNHLGGLLGLCLRSLKEMKLVMKALESEEMEEDDAETTDGGDLGTIAEEEDQGAENVGEEDPPSSTVPAGSTTLPTTGASGLTFPNDQVVVTADYLDSPL
eukprot:s3507_g9.t1